MEKSYVQKKVSNAEKKVSNVEKKVSTAERKVSISEKRVSNGGQTFHAGNNKNYFKMASKHLTD